MIQVLFNHVPKCAGSTINNYLKSCCSQSRLFSTDGYDPLPTAQEFKKLPQSQRYGYQVVTGHETDKLIEYVRPDAVTCTVLRDPVDRVVSYYWYMKQDEKHPLHEDATAKKLSEMLDERCPAICNWVACYFARRTRVDAEANPVDTVNEASERLSGYSLVGFQDDLLKFGRRLGRVAGLQKEFSNHHDNVTAHRPQLWEVPTTLCQHIASANWLDVRLYKRVKWEWSQR